MATNPPVHLFHIAYSPDTVAACPQGFRLLDNSAQAREDWREYWPIRRVLLEEKLDDRAWYGFLSPRFRERTGLDHPTIVDFIAGAREATEVVTFSPQPDHGAFFLNVFEQQEVFDPGFIAASEAFFQSIGWIIPLGKVVMDSRHIVFGNYFVARPVFWRRWFGVTERVFAVCEGSGSYELRRALMHTTKYPGNVQRKVYLVERIASLLLALEPKWRVRAYNTFACAWSESRLNQFREEAVLSDALKMAMREQAFPDYLEAFNRIRAKLER